MRTSETGRDFHRFRCNFYSEEELEFSCSFVIEARKMRVDRAPTFDGNKVLPNSPRQG